ncbi:hypothetical protein [Mycoplasma procyoni]|uniref:hypothetical protein n=1 Tax=Mycoplasma procyoni TaxID=568784 RepID=UPI00197C4570|nr:hypothetical protein [Mycoplasma procyoni]MBN3534887.1 hypothetical protein [Mycoplasma procyoni]
MTKKAIKNLLLGLSSTSILTTLAFASCQKQEANANSGDNKDQPGGSTTGGSTTGGTDTTDTKNQTGDGENKVADPSKDKEKTFNYTIDQLKNFLVPVEGWEDKFLVFKEEGFKYGLQLQWYRRAAMFGIKGKNTDDNNRLFTLNPEIKIENLDHTAKLSAKFPPKEGQLFLKAQYDDQTKTLKVFVKDKNGVEAIQELSYDKKAPETTGTEENKSGTETNTVTEENKDATKDTAENSENNTPNSNVENTTVNNGGSETNNQSSEGDSNSVDQPQA